MRDANWMRFEASGKVEDYLTYCRGTNAYRQRDDRNEDEDLDESELYPDRDGVDFHARG